jgi:hypothetical protein
MRSASGCHGMDWVSGNRSCIATLRLSQAYCEELNISSRINMILNRQDAKVAKKSLFASENKKLGVLGVLAV